MIKKNKKTIIITSIITLLPILIGLLIWFKLPDSIAIHFSSSGEANGYANKWFAVFGLPFILLVLHFVSVFMSSSDPKRESLNEKTGGLIFWICPAISLFMNSSIYAYALGTEKSNRFIINLFLGVLLIFVGNYLPKCKQNHTIGIKLPWTLSNEDNWFHTHRVAGWSMTICGVIIMASAFLGQAWITGSSIAAAVIIPVIYSYVYYLKNRHVV